VRPDLSFGAAIFDMDGLPADPSTAVTYTVEQQRPDAAQLAYIKALGEARAFYAARGFKVPRTEMTVMFRRPVGSIPPA